MLEIDNVTTASKFDVRDLWAKKPLLSAQPEGFQVLVPAHDLGIYRLSEPGGAASSVLKSDDDSIMPGVSIVEFAI